MFLFVVNFNAPPTYYNYHDLHSAGMWQRLERGLICCVSRRRTARASPSAISSEPTSTPWSPQDILNDRIAYMAQIYARPPRAIVGTDRDAPILCLYRLYEYLVLDHTIGYRNEIEYFWRHRGWPVDDIPDPQDPDPPRYAFLACIPHLLVRAFNNNIRIGLARYSRAILSPEEAEALQNTPEHEKLYESVPAWALRVAPLKTALTIPMVEGPNLRAPTDKDLDPVFLKLNIRLGAPHILFT